MSIKKNIFFFISCFILLFSPGLAAKKPFNTTWQYYFKKGVLQYKAEMYVYSFENMHRVLNQNSRHFEACNYIGHIYIIRNEQLKAMDFYRRSLKLNPKQPGIHNTLGEFYDYFFEEELAAGHYKQAILYNPSHDRAHLNLARYYTLKNDNKNAGKHFQISHSIGKKRAQKFIYDALSAESVGDHKKVIELHMHIISISPSLLESYFKLYELYRQTGKFVKAAAILEKLVYVKPDHEKAFINLGYLYFTKKFPGKRKFYLDKSIKNLERAIELNPYNYEIYRFLAQIYEFMGDDLKAEEWEKKAKKMEESHPDAWGSSTDSP
ncbi:MAG: hypothetical protein GY754_44415 [bacterium]|nr:hypothetical protein [bacterium]